MFGLSRMSPYQDLFNFQREVDRLFNQIWTDLPQRTSAAPATSFHVNSTDDGWQIDVPLPGIDPDQVNLEVAGNTLSIRADAPGGANGQSAMHYEQTFTVPQFLDIEKLSASHRHGMLRLTVPLKESVKPRRIPIETAEAQRQIEHAMNK